MTSFTVTRIPDAKDALIAALEADPDLQGVNILWDLDDDVDAGVGRTHRVIGILDTSAGQRYVGVRHGGGNSKDEDITIRVGVRHVEAGTARETEMRMWDLVEKLGQIVAHDSGLRTVFLGLPGLSGFKQSGSRTSNSTWDHRCEVEITCPQARLRP